MKLVRLLILLGIWGILLGPALCRAEGSGRDVSIKADSISHEQQTDIVTANGNVELVWEGIRLTSQHATYDRSTGILTAEGRVVMTKGGDVLKGESLSLNLQTGRGELENATATIQQSTATITGRKIVRNDDATLQITDTELTTCLPPRPSWKFSAGELTVNLAGYAIGRNLTFYVKDVPVLYLPWIAFPVVRERKTGLLLPKVGYSKSRGAQLDIPAYWVIAPNQDLLFDLDIQTRRGVGTGLEYRYARKRGSEGNFAGYLIRDLLDGHWRGQVSQNHREIFSPDMNLRMSVNLTSDRRFLNDFGEKSGDYNRQSSDTLINAVKTWQSYAVTAHLRYTEDYYATTNGRTLQTLPALGLAVVRQLLSPRIPLYFDMDSAVENLYRETGSRGQRLVAFPRLTLTGGRPGYLNASAYAGLQLRAYNTQNRTPDIGMRATDGLLQPELGAAVSSSISRIYNINGPALQKLRHELTAEVSYAYASPTPNQSRLPSYDYNDRPLHQNMVYYGVTSYLGGKFTSGGGTSEYRDLSRIKLMQGYSITGSRRDLLTMVDRQRPLTDVILETTTWLTPRARLTFDARYNVYENRISSAAPGLEFDDRLGNTASISYRMSRYEVEYLEAHLSTKLFSPWTLSYTARYSFDRGEFLEGVYAGEYRHQCWSVNMAFHDRPGNPSFTVNFNLAGLSGNSLK